MKVCIVDAIFVDGRELSFGPPLPFEKIRKIIAKQVRKLPSSTEASSGQQP
jgi:hypothetical protein